MNASPFDAGACEPEASLERSISRPQFVEKLLPHPDLRSQVGDAARVSHDPE
jgi:hypothetical protein